MSSSLFLLRKHSKPSHLLSILTQSRSMGGGPRTFKGGLSKWQHKRMHEKLAMEKERKLLNHEKQLYQARLRSEIRAKSTSGPTTASANGPMTSKDHIKALADRFMKSGAEDLWNPDDGPERERERERARERAPPPLDLRKIVRREYSTWGREESSDEEEEEGFGRGRKEMRSGAALGKYDVKMEKRRVLKEGDWKERIREIREEVREEVSRREGRGVGRGEEVRAQGSVLTEKR